MHRVVSIENISKIFILNKAKKTNKRQLYLQNFFVNMIIMYYRKKIPLNISTTRYIKLAFLLFLLNLSNLYINT